MPSLESLGKGEGIVHIVFQRAILPGAVTANGVDIALLKKLHLRLLVGLGPASDMDIGRIHNHVVFCNEMLVGDDTCDMEIVECALQKGIDVANRLVFGETYLDIKRHTVLRNDVVVESNTIEQILILGDIHPTIGTLGAFGIKTQIEDQNLVPCIDLLVVRLVTDIKQFGQGNGGNKPFIVQGMSVGDGSMADRIYREDTFSQRDTVFVDMRGNRVDDADAALLGIEEGSVVALPLGMTEIAHNLFAVGVREETPHGINIQTVEVGGVEFGIIGYQEFFCNPTAELSIEHLLEGVGRSTFGNSEKVIETIDELLLLKLVDIHLKRKVDMLVLVQYLRMFLHSEHLVGGDMLHDIVAEFGMLEVEEVAGIVPDETILVDGLAVAANLFLSLNNEVVVGCGCGVGEAGDTGTDNEVHVLCDNVFLLDDVAQSGSGECRTMAEEKYKRPHGHIGTIVVARSVIGHLIQ